MAKVFVDYSTRKRVRIVVDCLDMVLAQSLTNVGAVSAWSGVVAE